MGWFYGFKLHLVTNFKGEIVDAKLTTGNTHDTKPVPDITKKLSGKLYVDKGYTQATSKGRIQLECETPLGEALVEDNSYSIVKTNNDG